MRNGEALPNDGGPATRTAERVDVDEVTSRAAEQVADTAARLSEARLRVSSPRRIVNLVYDGHGEIVEMAIKPGAQAQYAADSMAGHATHALRSADRALVSMLQNAFGGIMIGDDTIAGWARHPMTAADTVSVCFGKEGRLS